MDIDAIEKRIRDAIAKVQAEGWTLRSGCAVSKTDRECCAIGAVGIAEGIPILTTVGIGKVIGHIEAWEISDGFDYPLRCTPARATPYQELGLKLRDEFLGVNS